MLNSMKLACILSVFLVVNGFKGDGFISICDFKNTVFVQEGNNATFFVDERHSVIDFFRGITMRRGLLAARMLKTDKRHVQSYDERVSISISSKNATITLQDVHKDDRGMYSMSNRTSTYCWELIVLDVWNPKGTATFEEFLPAYIDASPAVSRMVRPRVNATATWLLDDLNISQTTDFMEQDGRMIIMRMPRHLNAKNVTYRITEDNGGVHDVNLTLWVLYGPYSPLQFSPSRTNYFVTSGDVLPDITCSTVCNPPCEITWDRSGVGNTLSLGQVDGSSKGMYTCRATRNGTDRVSERSLYVEVNDETSFIVAVSVLGSILGMIFIFLCVCTVCWYRTSKRIDSCVKGQTARPAGDEQNRTSTRHTHETDFSSLELHHYEGLDRPRYVESITQDTYADLDIGNCAM